MTTGNYQEKSVNNSENHKEEEKKQNYSSYSYTSYDCNEIAEIDLKSCNNSGLSHNYPPARFRNPNNGKWDYQVYLPDGFDWDDRPISSQNRTSAKWVFHQLHLRRFCNEDHKVYERDEHVPLNYDVAYALDRRFPATIKELLKEKVIERDYYRKGEKSYGYRLVSEELRHATRRLCPLGDPGFVKRLRKQQEKHYSTRTDRWLRQQLLKIGLGEIDEKFLRTVGAGAVEENGGTLEAKLEAYEFVLSRIARRDHHYSKDAQGRRYTLVTNLKRELRRCLQVDGQPLCEIDIKNSQLLFLALEMKRDGVYDNDFFDACVHGALYESIGDHATTTRDAVKKALTQRALFSPNSARCQRSTIMKMFRKLYPVVWKYMFDVKNCKNGGSKLAKILQNSEADLVIQKVCGRLRRENQIAFVTPVHDCLLFLPGDSDYVHATMQAEFSKLGVNPTLEVKPV